MSKTDYNRNSMLLMVASFLSSMKLILLNLIFLWTLIEFFENDLTTRILWGIYMIYIFQRVIFIFESWYRLKYKLTSDGINIVDGIFSKNDILISFKNIQKIELSTSIFQKIFKQTAINIKTEIVGDYSEIHLSMLPMEEAFRIKKSFDDKKAILEIANLTSNHSHNIHSEKNINEQLIYSMDTKDIFLYSLLSLRFFLIIPLTISIYWELDRRIDLQYYFNYLTSEIDFDSDNLIMFVIGMITLITILSILYGFIWTYVKYRNFNVYDRGTNLYLKYGFTEIKEKYLFKNDIRFLLINQNLMMILLKKIKINAVMAEDTNRLIETEKRPLDSVFPFVNRNSVNKYMTLLTHDLQFLNLRKIKKLTLLDKLELLILFTITFCLCFGLLWFYITPFAIIFVSPVIYIFVSILNARYNTFEIHANSNLSKMYKGFLSNKIYLTKKENIEQLVVKQNFFQSKFDLGHIYVYLRENPVKKIKFYHVPMNNIEQLVHWWKNNSIKIVDKGCEFHAKRHLNGQRCKKNYQR